MRANIKPKTHQKSNIIPNSGFISMGDSDVTNELEQICQVSLVIGDRGELPEG